MEEIETALVAWHDADRDRVWFEEFLASRAQAVARRRELAAWLAGLGVRTRARVSLRALAAEDWGESWKKSFRVERVSERIVIKPSWEPYAPQPEDCVVAIDPGMSFGTGQHATTRACLRFMDRISREAPRASFLDVGCGSGILSIAAAKLGFAPVWAIDNDPAAVETARQNLARNAVAQRVRCRRADLAKWRAGRRFDVVAANLLAETLVQWASRLERLVAARAGSHLVLAGILNTQYDQVRERYEALGFEQILRDRSKEWTSGCFRRS